MTASLIDILAEEETLSPAEIERVVGYQRQRGGPLAEWLVRSQLISEDDLFFLMSRRLGAAAIPEERLVHLTLSPELRRRVPVSLAELYVLVPLDLDVEQGVLSVVMLDPSDPETLERLRAASRVATIRPYLGRRSTILDTLRAVYSDEDRTPVPPPDPLLGPREKRAVEAIRGKVEIDADLAEEIASLGESETADMVATAVKPLSEVMPAEPPVEDDALWDEHDRTDVSRLDDTDETYILNRPPPLPAEDSPSRLDAPDDGPPRRAGRRQQQTADDLVKTTVALRYEEPPPPPPDDDDTGYWPRGPAGALDEAPPLVSEPELALGPALPPEVDGLLGELFASVGVLVSMLEERIDPGGAVSREHARLARLVAREIGCDRLTIDRITVAAHLFGLDVALRREVGGERARAVTEAFAAKPIKPGGLNPTLRTLGARALQLVEPGEQRSAAGVDVIRIVSDYLDLRAESDDETGETLLQLLRAGGADPVVLDALKRVVEDEETLVATRRSQVTDRQG